MPSRRRSRSAPVPTRLAVGERRVWVVNAGDGTVTRIDPGRHAAVATIKVGQALTGIAAGLGGVWVTVAGGTPPETDRPHATRSVRFRSRAARRSSMARAPLTC